MCVHLPFPLFMVGEEEIIVEWKVLGICWHQCGQTMASDWAKAFSEAEVTPGRGRAGTGEMRR